MFKDGAKVIFVNSPENEDVNEFLGKDVLGKTGEIVEAGNRACIVKYRSDIFRIYNRYLKPFVEGPLTVKDFRGNK